MDGSNLSAKCTVNVVNPVSLKNLSLDRSYLEIAAGNVRQLGVTFTPTNTTALGLNWSSSNPKAATVDQTGRITAKSVGKTMITVSSLKTPALTAKCTVNVLFSDVTNKNLAAYTPIYWGVEKGFVNGYGSYFDIDANCTRAQFVLFLWRVAGRPAAKTTALKFKDNA